MKPSQLIPVLKTAFQEQENVILVGPPGVGKTDMTEQAAKEGGFRLMINHPVISEPTDYKGLPVPREGYAEFLPYGMLRTLMDTNEPTVFFMDDLGTANESVQAAAMQLWLLREIDGKRISDKVSIVAATNRVKDKAGVKTVIAPLRSRSTILEVTVDTNDWLEWAWKNNIHTAITSFINFKQNMLLDERDASREIVNTHNPRNIVTLDRWLKRKLPTSSEREVFTGAVGEMFATEFIGFLDIFRKIPDPVDVLKDPSKYIGKEFKLDVQYALAGALASHVEKNNFANFVTFIQSMTKEIEVMAFREALTRNTKTLSGTPEFMKWIKENRSVLL